MLLTQASRDLHSQVSSRWTSLEGFVTDPANAAAVAPILVPVASLHAHWLAVDHGLLSDPDDVDGAYHDLETAETYAVGVGYPPPAGYLTRTVSTVDLHPDIVNAVAAPVADLVGLSGGAAVGATDQGVATWAESTPVVNALTTPKPTSLGDRLTNALGEGLTGQPGGSVPWWGYAIGLGAVATLGLFGAAAYAGRSSAQSHALHLLEEHTR